MKRKMQTVGEEVSEATEEKVLQSFLELLQDLAENGESPVLIPPNSENEQKSAEERLLNTALLWIAKLFPDATAEMVYKLYQDLHGVSPVDSDQVPPPDHPSSAAAHQPLIKDGDQMSGGEAVEDCSAVVSERLPRRVGEIVELCPGATAQMVPPPGCPSTFAAAASHQPLINYSGRRRQKGSYHWSDEEHALFLLGVELYGHGDWTEISKNAVTTRTPVQLRTHSQKYYNQQEKNKRETKGKKIQRIHDRTLYDYPLDSLCTLISSRPVLKKRLKRQARPFAFYPDVMYFLRFRIHGSLPPLPLPPPLSPPLILLPRPQPPAEILLSGEPEKKGTVDKGESSSGRDQQEN